MKMFFYICNLINLKSDIMKKFLIGMILALAPLATFAQGVEGKWKLADGSAIVDVYQANGLYNGKIVWLQEPTEADGTPAVDKNNPDEKLRSRELMGLNLLSGLSQKSANDYSGGLIYDPGNGKTYYCSMTVDGDHLLVRGSLDKRGMFGRTMDWNRVK